MRIAVMGAGGVGAYLGARLRRAGADVAFVARGANLQAIRSRGLEVREHFGEGFRLDRVVASDDPSEIGAVDAVLFWAELYDTDSAAALCRPRHARRTQGAGCCRLAVRVGGAANCEPRAHRAVRCCGGAPAAV